MTANYTLKMIQMDLARQMETMDTVKQEFKRFADAGYNTVLLYLEDRVRTESYPYPADCDCYTPDQIREMIRYAGTLGLQLIPGLETLGHMEHFLKHPELAFLNECREPGWGRFGAGRNTLCVSNEKAVSFILGYVREIAQLFPSDIVHAGLDETFDFCSCPDCKALAEKLGGCGRLFLRHIQTISDVLASCGKSMMMWSDMLEFYPEIIPEIPRSVIMVDWQYDKDVQEYKGHFADRERCPFPQLWNKYGFRFITAPREVSLSNFITCIDASAPFHPYGALVTSWEHAGHPLTRTAPVTTADGLLMNGASVEEAIDGMTEQLFGDAGPLFKSALRTLCFNQDMMDNGPRFGGMLTLHNAGSPYDKWESQRLVLDIFRSCREKYQNNKVFLSLLDTLEGKAVLNQLQSIAADALRSGFTPERKAAYEQAAAAYGQLAAKRIAEWDQYRAGYPNRLEEYEAGKKKILDSTEKDLKNGAWLVVRYCLPDQYGRPLTKFEFTANGETRLAAQCTAKSTTDFDCIFERWYAVDPEFVPETVRVSYSSYGGTGICYVKYVNQSCTAVPSDVKVEQGIVEHPEHLLENDEKFCWFGSQNTKELWENRDKANSWSSVTLTMKVLQTGN